MSDEVLNSEDTSERRFLRASWSQFLRRIPAVAGTNFKEFLRRHCIRTSEEIRNDNASVPFGQSILR